MKRKSPKKTHLVIGVVTAIAVLSLIISVVFWQQSRNKPSTLAEATPLQICTPEDKLGIILGHDEFVYYYTQQLLDPELTTPQDAQVLLSTLAEYEPVYLELQGLIKPECQVNPLISQLTSSVQQGMNECEAMYEAIIAEDAETRTLKQESCLTQFMTSMQLMETLWDEDPRIQALYEEISSE